VWLRFVNLFIKERVELSYCGWTLLELYCKRLVTVYLSVDSVSCVSVCMTTRSLSFYLSVCVSLFNVIVSRKLPQIVSLVDLTVIITALSDLKLFCLIGSLIGSLID